MTVDTPEYRYRVSLIPAQSLYGSSRDITDAVKGMPIFTSTGGDEFDSAQIELYSPNGEFLTQDPILQYYDHFRIEAWDRNGQKYDLEYEYAPTEQALEITESKGVGTIITLNLVTIAYHTGKINYIKPIYRESGFAVARDIGDSYNVSRGLAQPELRGHDSNGLPTHIVNNYPYGDSPVSCKDRWQELATSFGAPPEDGGVQDFFTVGFTTGGNELNKINLVMKSLGSTPANPILITEGTLATDEDDKQTSFAPAKANRIIGIGNSQAGSLPTGFQRFQGLQLRHQFMPSWSSTVSYIRGEQVRDPTNNDVRYPIYQAISSVPAGTPLTNRTFWREISYAAYLGDTQYSEWTDDKAVLYRSTGTDPEDNTVWGKSIPDFNLVIKHTDFFRVPVDFVADDPADVPAELLYNGTEFYRGFRVLVRDGNQIFSGFRNVVVQYDGSIWRVKYRFTSDNVGAIVVDECTGNSYSFNGTTFVDNIQSYTRDCLHPYTSIENVQGAFPTDGMNTNQNSAVEITYDIPSGVRWLVLAAAQLATTAPDVVRRTGLDIIAGRLGFVANLIYDYISSATQTNTPQQANFEVDRNFYRAGVSFRFKFPFPSNTFGAITEDVGELYGGSTATGQEPATFDAQNSHYTHDGLRGYNNASSNDLGRGFGIGFFNKIKQTRVHTTDELITAANTQVRCFIRDTSDHVLYSDYTVPFNDVWSPQVIPFSSFKPYHALPPKELADHFIPPLELEQFDEFEWWNIKEIGFTMLNAYDDEGRFDTLGSQLETITGTAGALFAGRPAEDFLSALQGRTVRFAIDGLRIENS